MMIRRHIGIGPRTRDFTRSDGRAVKQPWRVLTVTITAGRFRRSLYACRRYELRLDIW